MDVCLNQRIHCHKVFAGLAARGHTSMGWFFGFKPHLMLLSDRLLLLRRAIIETIIDQLKNISQIEHSRHRSVLNFFVNVLCGLIAYCLRPVKPSLGLNNLLALPA